MTYRLLTCPETAHLELIEHIEDPLGTLIVSCSCFRPPCVLGCPRTCAALLDRGSRDLASGKRLGSSEESVQAPCEPAGGEAVDDTMVERGAEPEYRAYLEAIGSDHDGTWPHLGDE